MSLTAVCLIFVLCGAPRAVFGQRCELFPEDECGEIVCHGDCDADGRVSMYELVRGVRLATGAGDAEECPSLDRNGDSRFAIDEVIAAVGQARDGCDPLAYPKSVSFILSWLIYENAPDLIDAYSWPELAVDEFSLTLQHLSASRPPIRRGGEVTIIAVDSDGQEIARTYDNDNRWVWVDCVDPSQCRNTVLWYTRTFVSVSLPYDPDIVELRILANRGEWNMPVLTLLDRVPVLVPVSREQPR